MPLFKYLLLYTYTSKTTHAHTSIIYTTVQPQFSCFKLFFSIFECVWGWRHDYSTSTKTTHKNICCITYFKKRKWKHEIVFFSSKFSFNQHTHFCVEWWWWRCMNLYFGQKKTWNQNENKLAENNRSFYNHRVICLYKSCTRLLLKNCWWRHLSLTDIFFL